MLPPIEAGELTQIREQVENSRQTYTIILIQAGAAALGVRQGWSGEAAPLVAALGGRTGAHVDLAGQQRTIQPYRQPFTMAAWLQGGCSGTDA